MSSEQNLELTPTAVEGHGNTPAAWALVTLVMIGTLIGSIAFDRGSMLWVIIGIAVIILGGVAGGILKAAGFGKLGSRLKSHH